MNIIDAIQSGYPFRRESSRGGWYLYAYNKFIRIDYPKQALLKSVVEAYPAANTSWLTIDDIIADDWEVENTSPAGASIPNYSATNTKED